MIESFTPEERKILQQAALKRLPPGSVPPPAAALLGSIDAEPLRNSYLITITVRHEDPEAAALVANRYVEKFMDYLFESVGGKNEEAVAYLKGRAEQLRKDAEDAEKQLQDYMRQHNLVSLDKSIDIVSDRLKSVNTALTNARLEMLERRGARQGGRASSRRTARTCSRSPTSPPTAPCRPLKAQLSEAEQTQSLLMERYLEKHPKVIDNANKIAVTKAELAKAVDLAIADLDTRLSGARDSVRSLEKEYAAQEAQELSLRALSVDYNSLQSRATVAKSYYMEILDRLNQTTTFKNLDKISLHPLDRAQVPVVARYRPTSGSIMRTSVGLGVIVFLGVAIGLGFIDDRVKSAWDVESFIGVAPARDHPPARLDQGRRSKFDVSEVAAGQRAGQRGLPRACTARSRSSRSSTSRSRSLSRARYPARARPSSRATWRRASRGTARRRS